MLKPALLLGLFVVLGALFWADSVYHDNLVRKIRLAEAQEWQDARVVYRFDGGKYIAFSRDPSKDTRTRAANWIAP